MPLDTPTLAMQIVATLTGSAGVGGVVPMVPLNTLAGFPLTSGTGANQADKLHQKKYTIAPSSTQTLDLAGVLLDDFGAVVTFVKVKAIYFKAAVGNTNNVQIRRPATNGFVLFSAVSAGVDLLPGGALMVVNPNATGILVTAATGDLLDMINSGAGTSVDVEVVIIGTSA